MVQRLVQNRKAYLQLRGQNYYFRLAVPLHARRLCPSLPVEIKRSLKTDSLTEALALVADKLPLIKLLRRCTDPEALVALVGHLLDFGELVQGWVSDRLERLQVRPEAVSVAVAPAPPPEPEPSSLELSTAWQQFVEWKSWNPKRSADNQRLFDNLLFFIGDRPVHEISKQALRAALDAVAQLPQRNKKQYRGKPLAELVKLDIPEQDRVGDKYVREHLKICQSLFSRYLLQEMDILDKSPTEGLRLESEDVRFASLTDAEVRTVIERSEAKPEWFRRFILLAVYSGARRSEIANLRTEDIKRCPDTGRYYFVVRQGKTKAARRIVPVHKRLIEAGVLQWAEEAQGLLFPTANANPNRVTDMFGALLDRRVNELGERIVFHSLRHAFITKARAAGIETVLVQQVIGHEKSGAGVTDRYTHTFQLRELLPVVDACNFGAGYR